MSALVGVLAAGAAGWLVLAPDLAGRLRGGQAGSGRPTTTAPPDAATVAVLTGLIVGAVATRSLAGAAAGAVLAATLHRLWCRRRAEQAAARTRDALPDVLRLLAAELHAGATPHDALSAAAAGAPPELAGHLVRVAAGARLGLLVHDTLLEGPPGAEGLAGLASCWRVSADSGAGLATGVARLASGLAGDARCRAEMAAQLAGPRATAALLCALPGAAVLMGVGLGADPLSFFRTGSGAVCLGAGLALDLAGVAWARRIAAAATR